MFVNAWAWMIGLGAASLPVLIHWLTKPRPVLMPVSTLRFIRGAAEERRARHRIRDLLILALRSLAIACLALAISRPLWNQRTIVTPGSDASVSRIVILDSSQSMAARDGGIVRFERARPLVSELLKFRPSLRCNLLLAAATPGAVFDSPTSNLNVLRDGLAAAAVRAERLRVQQTLNAAAAMLTDVEPGTRTELIIVSDFQRSNWATADFSVFPVDCVIELRSVGSIQPPANLAILSISAAGRPEAGRETDISLQIGNYSDTPRRVRAELQLGTVVVPLEGNCPANTVATLTGQLPVIESGFAVGHVRLRGIDDALPDDDQQAVCIQIQPPPRIAILSRDRDDRPGSASYFVSRALAAARADASQSPIVIHSADPDVEALRAADVVVAARSGRLSSDTITVLSSMLQRGQNLLYIAADQLDVANLNDLTSAAGTSLRLPVTFLPLSADRTGTQRSLGEVNRRLPPFAVFGDELTSLVTTLRFGGGLVTRSADDGLREDVRASLNDQSAFLTVSTAGRGKLAVLNADLERSNLPLTPVLVPLLAELVSQELASGRSSPQNFVSGEPFTVQIPVGEEHLTALAVVDDAGNQAAPELGGTFSPGASGIVWHVPTAGPPGVYSVRLSDRTVAVAVAAIPREESDLRSLSADVFEDRLAGGRSLNFVAGSDSAGQSMDALWVWLAALCVMCVLLEFVVLRLFRT